MNSLHEAAVQKLYHFLSFKSFQLYHVAASISTIKNVLVMNTSSYVYMNTLSKKPSNPYVSLDKVN